MRKILLFIVCLFLLPALAAQADLYKWQDKDGNWNFADDLDKVPLRYRDQVKRQAVPEDAQEATPPIPKDIGAKDPAKPDGSKEKPAITQPAPGQKSYEIKCAKKDGSLTLDVTLNEKHTIPFVLDTGASSIALSKEVAEELGYTPDDILPRVFVSTANGVITCRLIRLSSVQVGDACVHDVVALVHGEDELGVKGLLGLNFLSEFDWSNDTMDEVLTLREFTNSPDEDVYGGHSEKWWRKKFEDAKKDVKKIEKQLQEIKELQTKTLNQRTWREWQVKILDANLSFYKEELVLLDRKASRYMVPRSWR